MHRMMNKAGWAVAGALAIALLAALAGGIYAGPLDPPAAPAPTGKTLEEIPGSWSRTLSATGGVAGPSPPANCNSMRFGCVLADTAVLDRETGLVWQLTPAATLDVWDNSLRGCMGATTGGRMGWRMPSLTELRSLVDSVGLPGGHPFVGGVANFWTGTTRSDVSSHAYTLNTANPTATFEAVKATDTRRSWCVRGGAGYDGL